MCHGLLIDHITADDAAGVIANYTGLFGAEGMNPDGDDDGDGELNGVDRCPNTPAGARVWHDQEDGKHRGCAAGQIPILY